MNAQALTSDEALADIRQLVALATGDEKHSTSAHSTLDVVYVLYEHVLRVDPADPAWPERDRFLLSKGHGPVAFYAVLACKGFFPRDELRRFLAWDGILGGHPDRRRVPGVEVSTGSLGHGLPMAIGVAYALRAAERTESRVFVLIGDGELNEGSSWEAILHAGARRIDNLHLIVVDNRSSTIDMGAIDAKLESFGWDVAVVDGHDHGELRAALSRRSERASATVARV